MIGQNRVPVDIDGMDNLGRLQMTLGWTVRVRIGSACFGYCCCKR